MRGLTAVVERGRVVRAVTEGTLVSMSILPCSIQLPVRKYRVDARVASVATQAAA